MTIKTCNTCKIERSLSDFPEIGKHISYKNQGVNRPSHGSVCRLCKAAAAREWRKSHTNYKGTGKLTSIPQEDRLLASAISERLVQAKERIKKYGQIETDLDRDYLYQLFKEQKGRCALSGVVMKIEKQAVTCLSLDKIKPALGYIKGNVQWVAWAINRAKGDMDEVVFIDMCRQVLEYQKVQRLSKGSNS